MGSRKISRHLEWAALIGILLVGAFLRLYQLEYKSLWVDEIGQVVAAQGGLADAIRGAAQHVAAPPLDYIVTWVALQVANNEFVLRFAPAAWSVLAIAMVYALAKHLTRSVWVAMVAAYLLALAPLMVRYAQEVRFYSLSVLLTLGCVYAFVRAWAEPTRRRWVWFAVVLVAAFYAHYYIAFVVAAMVAWAVVMRREWTRARIVGFGAALVALGVCAVPWLVYAGRGDGSVFVFSAPSIGDVVSDPVVGVNVDTQWRAWVDGLGMVGLPLLAVLGTVALWRTRRGGTILLLALLGTGVVGVLGGDWLLHYFYTPRQLLFLVPYDLILVGAGIVALWDWMLRGKLVWSGTAAGVTLAGITVVLALSLGGYYDWGKDDWRSAARLLEEAKAESIVTEPVSLGTYLVYYAPGLKGALGHAPTERRWIVTLDTQTPRALEPGWNTVRLDVSQTVNIFYAGQVAEAELLREAAAMDLPPQVLIYSDLLTRLGEVDPALARRVAERGRDEMLRIQPPLLEAQKARLERRLKRLE